MSEIVNRDDDAPKGKKTKKVITDPKSKASVRVITVNNATLDILRELREYYREKGFDTEGRVILNSKGNPASAHDLERTLKSICKASGLNESFTPHVFRHYFASKCIAHGGEGVFLKLSKHLGHSRPSVTMNIYAHVTEKQEDDFMKLLEAI